MIWTHAFNTNPDWTSNPNLYNKPDQTDYNNVYFVPDTDLSISGIHFDPALDYNCCSSLIDR